MAHPYHHALSSVKKWGGTVDDYLGCHEFFDASKLILADFRHRALRHHAEGVFLLEQVRGKTLTLSSGRVIPTRWVGGEWTKHGGHAARFLFATVSRPSRTAALVTATR